MIFKENRGDELPGSGNETAIELFYKAVLTTRGREEW